MQMDIAALEARMLDLRRFFPPGVISWKPGIKSKKARDWKKGDDKAGIKIAALAYGDFRAYMRRLDDVCGGNWSVQYIPWGADRLICELTIFGVTRSGTGEYSEVTKDGPEGTAAEAQAFKRACTMFGLGRYLYDLPSRWVEFDPEFNNITDAGKAELDAYYVQLYNRAELKFAELVRLPRASRIWSNPETQALRPKATAPQATGATMAQAEVKPDAVMDAVMADVQSLVDAAGLTEQAVVTAPAAIPAKPAEKPVEKPAEAAPAPAAAPAQAPAVDTTGSAAIFASWKGIADAKAWGKGQGLSEPDVANTWLEAFKQYGKINKTNEAEVFATFVSLVNSKLGK